MRRWFRFRPDNFHISGQGSGDNFQRIAVHGNFAADAHAVAQFHIGQWSIFPETLHLNAAGIILNVKFGIAPTGIKSTGVHRRCAFDSNARAAGQGARHTDGNHAAADVGDGCRTERGMQQIGAADAEIVHAESGVCPRGLHRDGASQAVAVCQRVHRPFDGVFGCRAAIGNFLDGHGGGQRQGQFQPAQIVSGAIFHLQLIVESLSRFRTARRDEFHQQRIFRRGERVIDGSAGVRRGDGEIGGVVVRVGEIAAVAARQTLKRGIFRHRVQRRAFGQCGGGFSPRHRIHQIAIGVIQPDAPRFDVQLLLESAIGAHAHIVAIAHQQHVPVARQPKITLESENG